MGGYGSKGDYKSKKGFRLSVPDSFNFIPVVRYSQMFRLKQLQELSYEILAYFDYSSLGRIACVNKLFYNLATDERIWKLRYEKDYNQKWMDFFSDRYLLHLKPFASSPIFSSSTNVHHL